MQIVTLISDFGVKGYRSAALKGALLTANPNLQLVDISHQITPFDIDEAAFILRSCFASFPADTIHLANVLNYYDNSNRIIYFSRAGQYFVGPDNGIFSLVFEEQLDEVYTLNDEEVNAHYSETYTNVVASICEQKALHEMGRRIDDMKQKLILQPVIDTDQIRGTVIYVDRYGNITVNIKKDLFDRVRTGRAFSVYFNRYDHIHRVSSHYMQVDIGTPLCNFNAQNYLEIAINLERADELLNIKKGDVIQVKFQD